MSWLKLYTNTWRHPKLARLKSDSERYAYVVAMQEQKAIEGRPFESAEHFAMLCGPYGAHLKALVRAELVDELPDGRYTVHDFEGRQAPSDRTAKERQARLRAAKKGKSPQVDKTVDNASRHGVTSRVTRRRDTSRSEQSRTEQSIGREEEASSGGSRSSTHAHDPAESPTTDDVPDDDDDAEFDALVTVLIMANVWTKPTKKMIRFLASLVRDHTQALVEEAIAVELKGGLTDDFMSRVAGRCKTIAIGRTISAEHRRRDSELRSIERDQDSIERIRAQPGAEATAAQRRAAIAAFADRLGSTTHTEGRTP